MNFSFPLEVINGQVGEQWVQRLLYYHQYLMCNPDITSLPCHLQALGTVLSI